MFKEKKPAILVLVLVLVIAALALWAILGLGSSKLSEEKKEQIEDAWEQAHQWHWESRGSRGCRYYGNYDGYDIVFYATNTITATQIVIADITFEYNYAFDLFAYKDDAIYQLKALYKSGEISADSIAKISQMHNSDLEKRPAISDDLQSQIQQAWFLSERQLHWNTEEAQKGSARYYGTHEGYDIFLFVNDVPPNCLSYYSSVIASSRFEFDCSCTIYARKDSSIYRLRDLYNSGEISEDAVEAIAKQHKKNS